MMDIIKEVRDDHQMLYDKRDVIRLLERQMEQYKTLDVHTDNTEVIANLQDEKEQIIEKACEAVCFKICKCQGYCLFNRGYGRDRHKCYNIIIFKEAMKGE